MVVRNSCSIAAPSLSCSPSSLSLDFLFYHFCRRFCDMCIFGASIMCDTVLSVPMLCKSSSDTETTLFCRRVNANKS